jgi:phospholipase/lecithinase/hemolysin
MPFISLTNSELSVEVSEEDYMTLLLLGPWCLNGSGYAYTTGKPKQALHLVVAARMGLQLKPTVDHKDRNKYNSKRDNLRTATYTEQQENKGTQKNNASGHKYICFNVKAQRWVVTVRRNHVGYYKSLESAIEARDKYLKLHLISLE